MGLVCVTGCAGEDGSSEGAGSADASAGSGDGGDGATETTDGDGSGNGSGSGSGGGSGSGDGSDDGADDGGSGGGGQCAGDGDCPDGTCVELIPGGVTVCLGPVFEATRCAKDPNGQGELPHECCNTGECDAGICTGNLFGPQCSGAKQIPFNICLSDQCTSSDDCDASMTCVPAGALGYPVATCVALSCVSDADCDAAAGGQCVVEPSTTCCADAMPRCRYPDTPPIGDECPP